MRTVQQLPRAPAVPHYLFGLASYHTVGLGFHHVVERTFHYAVGTA